MPTYEIDLAIRTHLTVEVEAADATEAWAIGHEYQRTGGPDEPVKGHVSVMYVDDVEQVRRKEEAKP